MFTIFATNTIAWNNQVQKDFEYVGAGDRLPYEGVSLTAVDKTYDIGSESYQWKSVHANTVEYDYIEDTKLLLVDQLLSITAFDIAIDGINGDGYNFFELSIFCVYDNSIFSATSKDEVILFFNNTISTYYRQTIQYNNFVGSATSTYGGNSSGFSLGLISRSTTSWQGNAQIFLKSDIYKQGSCFSKDNVNTACYSAFMHATNTSDTVTTLNFQDVGLPSPITFTSIYLQLWGMK